MTESGIEIRRVRKYAPRHLSLLFPKAVKLELPAFAMMPHNHQDLMQLRKNI